MLAIAGYVSRDGACLTGLPAYQVCFAYMVRHDRNSHVVALMSLLDSTRRECAV